MVSDEKKERVWRRGVKCNMRIIQLGRPNLGLILSLPTAFLNESNDAYTLYGSIGFHFGDGLNDSD